MDFFEKKQFDKYRHSRKYAVVLIPKQVASEFMYFENMTSIWIWISCTIVKPHGVEILSWVMSLKSAWSKGWHGAVVAYIVVKWVHYFF
jgi:hypothetical protein